MIISQLKAEIADLQQREREYHEALEQLKILEDKIESLRQERVSILFNFTIEFLLTY
jgi:uncharacterized protein involved in exopolysaccharide biosynthesis